MQSVKRACRGGGEEITMPGAKENYGQDCTVSGLDCDRVICRLPGVSDARAKAVDVFSVPRVAFGIAGTR